MSRIFCALTFFFSSGENWLREWDAQVNLPPITTKNLANLNALTALPNSQIKKKILLSFSFPAKGRRDGKPNKGGGNYLLK